MDFQGGGSSPKVIQDSRTTEPSRSECAAYEQYTSLSELSAKWESKEWLAWPAEVLVKPALQSLEMTFRLISSILYDSRPYTDKEEWKRRLESLTSSQLELISMICEGDEDAPICQLSASSGVLPTNLSLEVWVRPGSLPVVSRTSNESLLPCLGRMKIAEQMVSRIWLAIEYHMQRAPSTLGLGEPNLSMKPILEYDKICQPSFVYSFKNSAKFCTSTEYHTHRTIHQIFEVWIFVAKILLKRVQNTINREHSLGASKDCWVVERIWKLLTEIQSLFLLVDPDDFLWLKNSANSGAISTANGAYCLKSTALRSLTDACKELRNLVPKVVGVEADPKGGTRLEEEIMQLFRSNRKIPDAHHHGTVRLLLAFQAIEAALKRFFFSYQQLVIVVMGRAEMNPDSQLEMLQEMIGRSYIGPPDPLTQIYSEPPYFPSVDAAKTILQTCSET